jgi:hypothetical protein
VHDPMTPSDRERLKNAQRILRRLAAQLHPIGPGASNSAVELQASKAHHQEDQARGELKPSFMVL